ncbi:MULTISPECIES: hypothetical protein [Rhodococcus]|uniref:DGQHR domain-containing protein n=1 Tax=Rhodococcus cerastii TaxID=908616 RepID=A0ABU4D410_9NOCA|nr:MULTISPECIES: hypothetical protein [Rhodococcus]MDV6304460.1 hypothetical protein [Rhodococcus cerastii]MDV8057897.1 hypothetical protein [Rhodococcus sp. IEGM 1343]
MTTRTYRYPALRMQQTPTSRQLLLFGARAPEIEEWAGVPQRGKLEDSESVGFQRQETPARVRELAGFFTEQRNVVQNPLLCALQDEGLVTFYPADEGSSFGTLEIVCEDLRTLSLLELISRVIRKLEQRVPELKEHVIDASYVETLSVRAAKVHTVESAELDGENSAEAEAEAEGSELSPNAESADDVAEVLLTEETQLVDFYQELVARKSVLERISGPGPDRLFGFSKESMIGYLEPVVLVDGQHRLSGAVRAAEISMASDDGKNELVASINEGMDPDAAHAKIMSARSRILPVSLLMDPSPSEHVFQFVVVNQKATPIGKALLGTIVSTSLSRAELQPVADRLRKAGIGLEDSQAVAYLTRADESPFKGLVQTGVEDSNRLLPWTVLKGLTSIFRELKGGRLFHQKNDYAAKWRRRLLSDSKYVSEGSDAAEQFEIWQATDGPWREVFVRFFSLMRLRFGDDDLLANNAWGATSSNLYNKISLTILAADYFQFLDEKDRTLSSLDDVDSTVEAWLRDVDGQYFARDWGMGSLKKDQKAVREKWATTWFEYRKDPVRLPRSENYKP